MIAALHRTNGNGVMDLVGDVDVALWAPTRVVGSVQLGRAKLHIAYFTKVHRTGETRRYRLTYLGHEWEFDADVVDFQVLTPGLTRGVGAVVSVSLRVIGALR